jgi:hypothetical protein
MVPRLPARQSHFPSGRTVIEVAAGKQALHCHHLDRLILVLRLVFHWDLSKKDCLRAVVGEWVASAK